MKQKYDEQRRHDAVTFALDCANGAFHEKRMAKDQMGVLLAPEHTGMKISARGVLGRIRDGRYYKELNFGCGEMLRHLDEMAERFYSGDLKAVDEFLQLYDLADHRPALGPPVEPGTRPEKNTDIAGRARSLAQTVRQAVQDFAQGHLVDDDRALAAKIEAALRSEQEPLGAEFEAVWDANRSTLYES